MRRELRLLAAAAIFHVTVAIAVFGAGFVLPPGTIDTNGVAVSFAPDSIGFRDDALDLSDLLSRGQWTAWLTAAPPLPIKLFSLSLTLVAPLFGANIISIEPINAASYLAILVLVFVLGRDAFSHEAGVVAAGTVALWPSFLLHSTQFLKDSVFIGGLLGFILIISRLMLRTYSGGRAVAFGLGGGLLSAVLFVSRDNMADLVIATAILGSGLLGIRLIVQQRVPVASVVAMLLLTCVTVGLPRVLPKSHERPTARPRVAVAAPAPGPAWWDVPARVARTREAFFVKYDDAGSNIDRQIRVSTLGELVRDLPRAAAIGFFAPFPNMWFAAGKQAGSAARRISGLETVALYGIEGIAVAGLWRGRRRLNVWFLALVAAVGMTALGLAVVNVGALYRLRYAFVFLAVIVASGGAIRR